MLAKPTLHIAVTGCVHGQLQKMYEAVHVHEEATGKKVSFLICCGDFQSLRTEADFDFFKSNVSHRDLCDFHLYHEKKLTAPILTIFVGGNHEASNVLLNAFYGGYLAPNIYYMGFVGLVKLFGLRILGVSGIFKFYDVNKPFYYPPERRDLITMFHSKNFQIEMSKKLQAKSPIDVVFSHDWPQGIVMKGDYQQLYKYQPGFRKDGPKLGSLVNAKILEEIKPVNWFAGHMHCEYR
ncbi:lariat debranching enzyme, putative, partial [Entamoeba invadens IP1]